MSERIDAMADGRERIAGTVQLRVNGVLYGGWKSLDAEVGVEQCSGRYHLGVMDKLDVMLDARAIREGDECELLLDSQVVETGFVDDVRPGFDDKHHWVAVDGRDRTADLVDCSAIYKGGQWKNVRLDRIATDIAAPFGIQVVAVGDMGDRFDSFSIEQGERAFETIDRAARMRGLLVTTDGTGRLLITTPGSVKAATSLVEGVNIKSGYSEMSWRERYSQIVVKGQGKGDAKSFADAVAHGRGAAEDTAITRYRPLIVIAESHGKGPDFTARAIWERNVRRGRGTRATITVQGWCGEDGVVWKPNMLVSVQSPTLRIAEDLLIARCKYTLSERGTLTQMQLVHPSAFQVLPGVKGTRLNRRISGVNGLEDNRRHARKKARIDKSTGAIIDFETGKER